MSGRAGAAAAVTYNASEHLLVVARTHRPDVLNNFKLYSGGWNLSSMSYFAIWQLHHPRVSYSLHRHHHFWVRGLVHRSRGAAYGLEPGVQLFDNSGCASCE